MHVHIADTLQDEFQWNLPLNGTKDKLWIKDLYLLVQWQHCYVSQAVEWKVATEPKQVTFDSVLLKVSN